jgi:hypothetical protein
MLNEPPPCLPTRSRRGAALLALALVATAASAATVAACRLVTENAMKSSPLAPTIPPLDAAVPGNFETATFALG